MQNERIIDKIEDDDEDFVDDEEVDREYEDKDVDGMEIHVAQWLTIYLLAQIHRLVLFLQL